MGSANANARRNLAMLRANLASKFAASLRIYASAFAMQRTRAAADPAAGLN
jgi:hypothetical protein